MRSCLSPTQGSPLGGGVFEGGGETRVVCCRSTQQTSPLQQVWLKGFISGGFLCAVIPGFTEIEMRNYCAVQMKRLAI